MLRKLLELCKWTIWLGALAGAFRRAFNFSRQYMLTNIGCHHMFSGRFYLTIWKDDGSYIFIADVYSPVYKDIDRLARELSYLDCMFDIDWGFAVRLWWPHFAWSDNRSTMMFNDIPDEILSSWSRFRVWRYLSSSAAFYEDIHVPEQFIPTKDTND